MAARVFASATLIAVLVVAGLAIFAASGDDSSDTVATETASAPASSETESAESGAEAADAAEPASDVPAVPPVEPPPVLGTTAELTNLDGWLQSDISSLGELDGKVHVVQFWTFGCYNCKNTLPNLIELNERHADDNFEIVGVHAPEFEFEKDPDNILSAAEDLGVTWPIALDTSKTNFRSWQESRRFWPRTYVIDQNGEIRFDRIGEGAYDKLNETVAYLLDNPPAQVG